VTVPPRRIVVADANVLINLMHVSRLDMCAQLRGYEFVVPDHVREEVTEPAQRAALDDAVARGVLRVEAITDLNAVALFAELTVRIGRGEAACLAIAVEEADADKAVLERCRFKMPFRSFGDLVK
jgi:predicted nucleic acid-binding protein